MKNQNTILLWLTVFVVATVTFYGADMLIMAAQGLPLNWNLTPAQ